MSRSRDTADQINRLNSSAADATAITIDSSENVLVGKTVLDTTSVGAAIGTYGAILTRDGGEPLLLNRNTSDGTIAQFRKDNTTVGSIGTTGGKLYIGTLDGSDAFLRFESNEISPCAHEGSFRDNVINLGKSVSRFKDLYLSGGVYLGGTGSANKLDDYEEGTWTPTLPNGGTVGIISKAVYTKVGNLVNAYCNVYLNPTNNSTQFNIGGLPFAGTSNNHGGGTLSYTGGIETRYWSAPLVNTGSEVYFHRHDASTATVLNSAFGGANRQFIMQLTYSLN